MSSQEGDPRYPSIEDLMARPPVQISQGFQYEISSAKAILEQPQMVRNPKELCDAEALNDGLQYIEAEFAQILRDEIADFPNHIGDAIAHHSMKIVEIDLQVTKPQKSRVEANNQRDNLHKKEERSWALQLINAEWYV